MKMLLLMLLFVACVIHGQEKNKQIDDEKSGKKILVGICDRSVFADTNYSWWFNSEYENYTPQEETVRKIQKELKEVVITIILGTWCSDSRREIPRLLKILDAIDYDSRNINLICVDRNKRAIDIEIDKFEVKLVPTIIFLKGEHELGRIIESPNKKLEQDILEIILSNDTF